MNPREFYNVNLNKPESYYDYENYKIKTGNINNYLIRFRLGRGKYSEGFGGKRGSDPVVIKLLKPVRESRIQREILILKNLNHKNIIHLDDVVVDKDSGTYSLIFKYIAHDDTLLTIHIFYHPNKDYSVRVASRYYKSPELLVNYQFYNYSLDIWSFGCVFAEMIFKKRPFFNGKDNFDQLYKICKCLGTRDLFIYAEKFNISLKDFNFDNIQEEKKTLKTFCH
ncbi:casein kinase ii subunit alpha [Vairimorpha apis BRL 01]|uniref:non-specific serine/threonine protein kinase n=1 Tax=Vairimorpha apis BRL 01 TaxID=1037528 RepID=T0LDB0_9MICR|nr:casein kinase ii subunit alpha [Vairimorpha apis BRL 01]